MNGCASLMWTWALVKFLQVSFSQNMSRYSNWMIINRLHVESSTLQPDVGSNVILAIYFNPLTMSRFRHCFNLIYSVEMFAENYTALHVWKLGHIYERLSFIFVCGVFPFVSSPFWTELWQMLNKAVSLLDAQVRTMSCWYVEGIHVCPVSLCDLQLPIKMQSLKNLPD